MTREELFDKMKKIVDTYVKSYKEDFESDMNLINTWENECGGFWAVWCVREHGTQLQRFTNAIDPMEYVNAVFSCMRVEKTYVIEFKHGEYELMESSYEDVVRRYKQMDEYDIEVYATDCYTYLIRNERGVFNSDLDAETMGDSMMHRFGGKSYRVERL